MSEFYYARMKFCGENGFEQIQIREGRAVVRQWLPESPEILKTLRQWNAKEVTPEKLAELYRNGVTP